jgi:hypothetical protein
MAKAKKTESTLSSPEQSMVGRDDLKSCVGDMDAVNKYIGAIDSLCNEFGFCGTEFVRMFRAFRLLKKQGDNIRHVDWISLDELNYKYRLALPPAKGAARNYQRPFKRQYH